MAKIADRYFLVDPWKVVEEGFDPSHGRAAESVFSLANEYMGVRGYFEEGYGGDSLPGSYVNGIYADDVAVPWPYKGMVSRECYIVNCVDWLYMRITLDGELLDLARCKFHSKKYFKLSFEEDLEKHIKHWTGIWDTLDIVIEGDPENQQGVHFCIFNLLQTYHGEDSTLNIGGKGLTGEAYGGRTWWDTESYILPFYLFINPKAAHNLVEYRYHHLPKALERAEEMDCAGACYPMSTIDGT